MQMNTTEDDCAASPSCDSEELAAIRARAIDDDTDTQVFSDRDALLRMVDELTMVSDSRWRRIEELESYSHGAAESIDELRAKLANVCAQLDKNVYCFACEASFTRHHGCEGQAKKLAEAEKKCGYMQDLLKIEERLHDESRAEISRLNGVVYELNNRIRLL
jgi:hypothetical protein